MFDTIAANGRISNGSFHVRSAAVYRFTLNSCYKSGPISVRAKMLKHQIHSAYLQVGLDDLRGVLSSLYSEYGRESNHQCVQTPLEDGTAVTGTASITHRGLRP
jgi:hypothetical protein